MMPKVGPVSKYGVRSGKWSGRILPNIMNNLNFHLLLSFAVWKIMSGCITRLACHGRILLLFQFSTRIQTPPAAHTTHCSAWSLTWFLRQSEVKFLPSRHCFGAATFLSGSGTGSPRSRRRLLRLRPNWVGSGSRQKKTAPAPCTNIFHFEFLKSELLIASLFGSHFTFINCSQDMFCHKNKAFLFCLPKRFSRSRPTKTSAPAPP